MIPIVITAAVFTIIGIVIKFLGGEYDRGPDFRGCAVWCGIVVAIGLATVAILVKT